jgi:tRNA-splicing ligase RtcB (3'-phosphate/5'-hydroxy nucleic acid ligase)
MKDVYTTSVNKDTLDEAPQAYKDSSMILEMIKDTVDVEFIMKPIYNFKAGGE